MSFARVLALGMTVLALALPGRADGVKPYLANPALAGLWYSAEGGIWIRVWDDALAFQCRTSAGEILSSTGFVLGWIVLWDRNWSTQAATITADDKLVLRGGEDLTLTRAVRMGASCEERSPQYEPAAP